MYLINLTCYLLSLLRKLLTERKRTPLGTTAWVQRKHEGKPLDTPSRAGLHGGWRTETAARHRRELSKVRSSLHWEYVVSVRVQCTFLRQIR